MTDSGRRSELYRGSVFLYSRSSSATKLCDFAREMVEEAFHPLDPRKVQDSMPVQQCVEILSGLKPKFIHHPKCKEYLRDMLAEFGCDLEKTYFDVPRLRTAFPSDYLSAGIAYAFHPHRDTWYSAPMSQINWWMPVYEICSENCMAFHPRYWSEPVRNSSNGYNYYEWNRVSRKSAAQHVGADTRVQPHALDPIELEPQMRVLSQVGGAMLFSGAQMHSTVPNTCGLARYSIDFRTVHLDDVRSRGGAPNIDSACTGTTMHDYLRGTDLSHIPEEDVALYDDGTEINFVPSPTAVEDVVR
jgi:hypothetical protein